MAYERYLQETGSSYILLESGGFLLLESSDLTAPVVVTETPAGRPRRRFTKYVLRVDGEEFPCRSLDEALVTLDRAKALAKKISQERVRAATEPRASLKPLPVPKITGNSKDLKPAVMEAVEKIEAIYRSANMDMEIALWFAKEREQEDDETAILFFM